MNVLMKWNVWWVYECVWSLPRLLQDGKTPRDVALGNNKAITAAVIDAVTSQHTRDILDLQFLPLRSQTHTPRDITRVSFRRLAKQSKRSLPARPNPPSTLPRYVIPLRFIPATHSLSHTFISHTRYFTRTSWPVVTDVSFVIGQCHTPHWPCTYYHTRAPHYHTRVPYWQSTAAPNWVSADASHGTHHPKELRL